MTSDTKILLDGLCFPEGPRWEEGKLWFSDMHAKAVIRVGLDGVAEKVVEVAAKPSGLGWLPDGRLLVVSMQDRRLLRLDPGGLKQVADLSAIADFYCNDMVVDAQGRAYVGNFGFDLHKQEKPRTTALALVLPSGEARVAARDLAFPNGCVITPDGRTLVVAESMASRLTAFDIAGDGSLSNRRVFAQLERKIPDGICLDAEGAIWMASAIGHECVRVHEGGRISATIQVETQAYACMLGGPDRKTLFLCTAEDSDPDKCVASRSGRIETVRVDVAGVGLP